MKLEQANSMTQQELYDYSISKLVEQGDRCFTRVVGAVVRDVCRYGYGECHCGIGWMLDETKQNLMGFDSGVNDLITTYPDDVPEVIRDNPRAAQKFQNLHDSPTKCAREYSLRSLQEHGLDTTTNPDWQKWVEMGI